MSMARINFSHLYSIIDDLSSFLGEFSNLTECSLVNFITHNLFSTLLSSDLGDLLLELSDEELSQLPSCQLIDILISSGRADRFRPVIDFLQRCRRFQIEIFLGNDALLNDCWADASEICRMQKLKSDYCTDQKKSHEVEAMASAVATMAEMLGTDLVVDIGSGRGYLGSLLGIHYGLRVLGLDASDCNTHSAHQRLDQVRRDWKTVLRRSCMDIQKQSTVQLDNRANNREGIYQPITCAITASTDIDRSIDACQLTNGEESLIFCGLHTCGDLASHTLKMFLNCQRAKGLLSVGCCYHLIEEKYSKNPFRKEDDRPPDFYGFPISDHFRKKKYAIGRNTRMLTSQPVSKMAKTIRLPHRAVFWRALLQQLIWDKLGRQIDIFEKRVGRVAKRCKNFKEYVPKALKNLELNFEILDDEIEQYQLRYASFEHKMDAFFQLRCALAQPVETLVLMDRLCYLLEHDSVLFAKIVPLFDPMISPRCYAIWSIKKR